MNTKNKTIAVLMAAIMVSAIWTIVPMAMATVPPVTTQVEVIGDNPSQGDAPIIKAKWEKFSHYTDSGLLKPDRGLYTLDYMTYDDDPTALGIQVFPPGQGDPQGEIDVEFWAVVTDKQGFTDISFVSADVYHPPLWVPEFPEQKYQVMLLWIFEDYLDLAVKAEAFAELEAAHDAGAITYNEIMEIDPVTGDLVGTGVYYTLADLKTQYEKGEAWIFQGVEWLDYHQPWGPYRVKVCAADQGLKKDYKENTFEYVKEESIALDFNTLDYGQVKINMEVPISGDEDMTTPGKPTVKNLGNCPATINVHFDDMKLGWRTENGEQIPNVQYDARLGLYNPVPVIWPSVDTPLPGVLPLCNELELDFSILVSKAEPGKYTGTCTIWATDS